MENPAAGVAARAIAAPPGTGATLPLASRVSRTTALEQAPASTVCGAVTKAICDAGAGSTVSTWTAAGPEKPAPVAVRVTLPATVARNETVSTVEPAGSVSDVAGSPAQEPPAYRAKPLEGPATIETAVSAAGAERFPHASRGSSVTAPEQAPATTVFAAEV